jgi:Predicted transcriptional regulators
MYIGQYIYHYRKLKNMTQEKLAEKIGTTKQTINKYELGIITNIPLNKIEKLASALDCTISDLLGSQKEKPALKGKLIEEIENLFTRLTPDKQEQVLDSLRFLHGQSNNS